MNRIDSIFAGLRAANRRALMPFICGGYPSLRSTSEAIVALQAAGASVVEVGFPFSDPIADGPVIAAAMHEALEAGVTPAAVLEAVAESRRNGATIGVVAMASMSIVHRMGVRTFVRDAAASGIDGVIVPDAPVEEAAALEEPLAEAGLSLSLLVAPTTPPPRAERIVKACTGFVYLLARTGITGDVPGGAGPGVDVAGIAHRVAMLRGMTDLPIACGFGIATADQVRLVVAPTEQGGAGADAAIVGSALVRRMGRAAAQGRNAVEEAELFVRGLAIGL
ncbi:MAG: tryptophan synthase subunit alpha [Phycisphaerae bacterium]|nr:tryptophan synthase subunit alpha [Phycisphaerae bacterium]